MADRIPRLGDRLPDLLEFVRTLAGQIEAGRVTDGAALTPRIRDFYTPERMQAIESVVPGWGAMAAAGDGVTLHHITQAMIAINLLPEYRQAQEPLQTMLEWTVLYHDVGKQVVAGQRDALHAFRSATMAARALPDVGFPVTAAYPTTIDPWTYLVLGAAVAAPDGKGRIPDNRALPAILGGIDRLFGPDTAAALIVQAVLLHQSLNVVPEWPNPGSLADADVPTCLRRALVPLLEAMMLVDSDAWQLFDAASKAKYRSSTLAVFADVRRRVTA